MTNDEQSARLGETYTELVKRLDEGRFKTVIGLLLAVYKMSLVYIGNTKLLNLLMLRRVILTR